MIVLILIFAFILRLVNLNQSLWLDEAVQAITAQNNISYIFQEITGDFHPPLYYFLMHFWVRIFGSSEIALRMPSVLFGVGTVYLIYKICNLSGLRNLGYLSALFLATAPFHIYYSQEARMYSMVTFFAALSMYFFMKINGLKKYSHPDLSRWTSGSARNDNIFFICYFIATLLMIYSDYYGFLVLSAQMIYLLTQKKYKFLLICLFAYLLIFLPWVPMFVKQIQTGMLATQILPGWGKLVNASFVKALPITFIKFSIGRITIFDKRIYAGVGLLIGVFYGGLFWRSVKGLLKEKLKDSRRTIIFLWFSAPLIISWLASLFIPNFQPFRLLLILPAFYLILAMGIGNITGKRWIGKFAITAVLTINIVSLSVYFFNPYFWREDWKGLVKYLVIQKDSTVILPSSASNWPVKYYDKEKKISLITGINGAGEIRSVGDFKEADNNIYYIRYLVPLFDPNELILANLQRQGYTKVNEISFNQIPVWKYELKD